MRMLESELERTLTGMKMTPMVESEEYVKMLTVAERLHELMVTKKSPAVSRETLITVGANLLGILMILNHEYAHPVTSKALGFVIRAR
jgi:dsDNA-binding SOS-regulon protein